MANAASRIGCGLAIAAAVLALPCGLFIAYGADSASESPANSSGASTPAPVVAQPARPADQPAPLKLLKVEPVKGYVGESFTVTGAGFTPGEKVELVWSTADAAYVTKVRPDNLEYHERKYEEKRVRLGSTTVDGQGRIHGAFTAPEDFGEVHDLYAVVEGRDIARGGFRILRSASMTPSEGPLGTPITITVKGLGFRGFEQFMALRYDNKYTGELSAVTTRGTAVFQIRAAGRTGGTSRRRHGGAAVILYHVATGQRTNDV